MRQPDDVHRILSTRWANQHKDWFAATIAATPSDDWPLAIPLKPPTESMARRDPAGLAAWISCWRDRERQGHCNVLWAERQWPILGRQTLPEHIVVGGPAEAAALLGQAERWRLAEARGRELHGRWPQLASAAAKQFDLLADWSTQDFTRLAEFLEWLLKNPDSGLYPRQVPVRGIDSKWLERRSGPVTALWLALRADENSGGAYPDVLGLRAPPAMIRLRVLDPDLRLCFNGLTETSATADELGAIRTRPRRLLMVENLQNAIALPDIPGTLVVMGLGKGTGILSRIPWLYETAVGYWGDIDTHGLHILGHTRKFLPGVRSLLMDQDTLLAHRDLWVEEPSQAGPNAPEGLTDAEADLLAGLKCHRWGVNVRLEQERISWDYVLGSVAAWIRQS